LALQQLLLQQHRLLQRQPWHLLLLINTLCLLLLQQMLLQQHRLLQRQPWQVYC
jgi:hypothetical protein